MAGNSNSGRLPKSDEQQMIEKLSVLEDDVIAVLKKNINQGKAWAIRIWFDRTYGKPKEYRQTDMNVRSLDNIGSVITWRSTEDMNNQ